MYNKKVLIDSLKNLGSAKAPTKKKDVVVGLNNPIQMSSMKQGGSSLDKQLSVKKSNIQGNGLFINEPIRKGDVIGLAHINNQATPIVGKNHNHSENNPTAVNISQGNKRYLVAAKDLPAGTEITTNYRLQPELEQPEDFMRNGGMTPQKDGYRTYSPFKNLPFIDIETDTIDTDNIVYDLQLVANNGVTKNVQKNTGLHKIPGASVIREIPIDLEKQSFKQGGALLNKTMTCGNCGWKWKAADGGSDITTCHKCGGKALPIAQDGKEIKFWTPDKDVNIVYEEDDVYESVFDPRVAEKRLKNATTQKEYDSAIAERNKVIAEIEKAKSIYKDIWYNEFANNNTIKTAEQREKWQENNSRWVDSTKVLKKYAPAQSTNQTVTNSLGYEYRPYFNPKADLSDSYPEMPKLNLPYDIKYNLSDLPSNVDENSFRNWINKYYPDYATNNQIDNTTPNQKNNDLIKSAWYELGDQYAILPELKPLPKFELNSNEDKEVRNDLKKPKSIKPLRFAYTNQTVMEPDPRNPGGFRVKDIRRVPYSENHGRGWESLDPPRVMYYNPETGEETPATIKGKANANFQDGGKTDAMTGMMKARLAYANEFGNPAAKRMINIPDNPYQFDNGDIGTHYMASYDNYAVPQIQDENGELVLGDYGPESNEAIRFDSDEDANYFAEHYKDVSPGFINAELTDDKIQEYIDGGYIIEDLPKAQLGKAVKAAQTALKVIPSLSKNVTQVVNKLGTTYLPNMGELVNKSITPIGYDPFTVAAAPLELLTPKALKFKPKTYATKNRFDAWRLYNGLEPEFNTFSKNADGTLLINDFRLEKSKLQAIVDNPKKSFGTMEVQSEFNFAGVHGNGWIKKGVDEQGRKFIDFTDTWDIQPLKGVKGLPKKVKEFEVSSLTGGKPFDLKNRIYYDDASNFFDHNGNKLVEEMQHFPKGVVDQHKAVDLPMLSTKNVVGTKQMDVLYDWNKAVDQKFYKGTGTFMLGLGAGMGYLTYKQKQKLKKQNTPPAAIETGAASSLMNNPYQQQNTQNFKLGVNFSFEDGGAIEAELTDDKIEQYINAGYIIEELPKAQLGKSVKAGINFTSNNPLIKSMYKGFNSADFYNLAKGFNPAIFNEPQKRIVHYLKDDDLIMPGFNLNEDMDLKTKSSKLQEFLNKPLVPYTKNKLPKNLDLKVINGNNTVRVLLKDAKTKKVYGQLALQKHDNDWFIPGMIDVHKELWGHKVQDVLYQSGIDAVQNKGYKGIRSGDTLWSPAKTAKAHARFNTEVLGPFTYKYLDDAGVIKDIGITGLTGHKDSDLYDTFFSYYSSLPKNVKDKYSINDLYDKFKNHMSKNKYNYLAGTGLVGAAAVEADTIILPLVNKDYKSFLLDYSKKYDQQKRDQQLKLYDEKLKKELDAYEYNTGGAIDYELGDEIDEATMQELKELGYTFEKI
jgi:hypothetical protein